MMSKVIDKNLVMTETVNGPKREWLNAPKGVWTLTAENKVRALPSAHSLNASGRFLR